MGRLTAPARESTQFYVSLGLTARYVGIAVALTILDGNVYGYANGYCGGGAWTDVYFRASRRRSRAWTRLHFAPGLPGNWYVDVDGTDAGDPMSVAEVATLEDLGSALCSEWIDWEDGLPLFKTEARRRMRSRCQAGILRFASPGFDFGLLGLVSRQRWWGCSFEFFGE